MTKKISFLKPILAVVLAFSIFYCKESKKEEAKDETTVVKEEVPMDSTDLALLELNLPEGFDIKVFARGVDGARSMAMGNDGTLFVGTRNENTVYAIQDENGDYVAETVMVLDTMEVPNGIAM